MRVQIDSYIIDADNPNIRNGQQMKTSGLFGGRLGKTRHSQLQYGITG